MEALQASALPLGYATMGRQPSYILTFEFNSIVFLRGYEKIEILFTFGCFFDFFTASSPLTLSRNFKKIIVLQPRGFLESVHPNYTPYDWMMVHINDPFDPEAPPYVALHSSGDLSKDQVILETFISNTKGHHTQVHKEIHDWFACRIAIYELEGKIPETEKGLYNLALRNLVTLHREKLKAATE